ncbi:MAG: hypothetical protein R2710_15545 [Acidimicrobiales bacterium]
MLRSPGPALRPPRSWPSPVSGDHGAAPRAPHDHQTATPAKLVEAGGGFRIADRDLSVATGAGGPRPPAGRRRARASMAAAAASVGRPDAADAVASIIIETGKLETTP